MFTSDEKRRVTEAVAAVEKRTSGELVLVWTPRSDDYAVHRGAWALAFGAGMAFEFGRFLPASGSQASLVAAGLTCGLYFLFGWAPLLRLIAPERVQEARAHERAKMAFVEFGVDATSTRGGVLLFLSAVEHQVVILADQGIHGRVGEDAWRSTVDGLVVALREGRTGEGVLAAIARLGEILEREFPRGLEGTNELGDEPRKLPGR